MLTSTQTLYKNAFFNDNRKLDAQQYRDVANIPKQSFFCSFLLLMISVMEKMAQQKIKNYYRNNLFQHPYPFSKPISNLLVFALGTTILSGVIQI